MIIWNGDPQPGRVWRIAEVLVQHAIINLLLYQDHLLDPIVLPFHLKMADHCPHSNLSPSPLMIMVTMNMDLWTTVLRIN